ncbi:replication-relaxation family protein [Subtercola lobariae]|uniref:Replication-relaxation n=1 Tax=Subtercola lobariae TaxID=1588641 RepID=A0A917EX99_9MICO|nr:replication-relaxation family protein [Subtercola lobariae]GGF18601.1 hypothetical protein GCM10011399_10290 [Subtercola lobariae]
MSQPNRKGTLSVASIKLLLTARDRAILQSLYAHKFLTGSQIYNLHFWNHHTYASGIRACNRVLGRLRGHRLIYRLERPMGGVGGGSSSFVWSLDAAGDRFERRTQEGATTSRSRSFVPTTMFLLHTLAVADVHIQLIETERSGRIKIIESQFEPRNWRTFLTRNGSQRVLKPDLFVSLSSADYDDFFFIEVDRGTESIPTLIRKCLLYEAHRRSGDEQERLEVYPLVVWLVPTAARRDLLQKSIDAEKHLDPQLFSICVSDDFRAFIDQRSEPQSGGDGV